MFIFYIAEMLTNTTSIKIKYVDGSQILVSDPVKALFIEFYREPRHRRKLVQDMKNSDERIQNGNNAHKLRWTDDFCLPIGN